MIGRCAYNRQAQRHVHAIVEMQRLDRDQRLIVIHAQRRVIMLARQGMEHGVRCIWSADIHPFLAQRFDSRRYDVDFLASHIAAFTRMGVKARNPDTRLLDTEIAHQPLCRHQRARTDQVDGKRRRYLVQRYMDGDRHHAQRRPGQHHHRIAARYAAPFGDEFRLARMGEPD